MAIGFGLFILIAPVGCQTASAQTSVAAGGSPDLAIGEKQFPDEDAVILRWEQSWTVEKDGTVRRRDHRWLKLLTRRPIRAEADPRIDYVDGRDEVIIHAARTHLPDGEAIDVPEYSVNIAAPNDVAGWPAYAAWQQKVISFSGIKPGVVLELDYEIVTPAGALPWIDADLQLKQDYPTVERIIRVAVPKGQTLRHHGGTSPPVVGDLSETTAEGAVTYRWTFQDLPGDRAEPQSLPWQQRSGRLRFSTCPSNRVWVSTILEHVDKAGQPDETVKTFAEAAVEQETDPIEKIRKLSKKLHDSFNFITSRKTLQTLQCRGASRVLRANYGNPLEAGALCLAALRSLGFTASAQVGVEAYAGTDYGESVSTASALAGVVTVVQGPDGPIYVHPQEGVVRNPGRWGRHRLLTVDGSGSVQDNYVYARGEREPSDVEITGRVAVSADGKASGELRVELTGQFYDPTELQTADAQKSLLAGLVKRVLSGFEIKSHSIVALSDAALRATVQVATVNELERLAGQSVLRMGSGPAFLTAVPLPLDHAYRTSDVELNGRLREHVDITVDLPDKRRASVVPASVPEVKGAWGSIAQDVESGEKTVRFRRRITLDVPVLSPEAWRQVRNAVNTLRTDQSLMLAVGG